MDTLTLDTSLLLEYWKDQDNKKVVEDLLRLAIEGRVNLAVTARVREDVAGDPFASRINQLGELGIQKTGAVARLDYWILERDHLGSVNSRPFASSLNRSGRRVVRTFRTGVIGIIFMPTCSRDAMCSSHGTRRFCGSATVCSPLGSE